MIVLIHVLIALASLSYTSYVFFRPSKAGLRTSYALAAATVASGVYLIWNNPAHMTQSCATGLLYLGLVGVGIASARSRLVSAK